MRRALWVAAAALLTCRAADAQTRFMYLRGQIVSPAYEGWWPNDDGSYTLFFGYMNSNWEQQFDVPVGPKNYFAFTEPGGLDDLSHGAYDDAAADQGQPTHFYPRRNPFLFTVQVPADFGETELVWTLETQGATNRAYGSLKSDYRINPQVISTEVGGDFGSLADNLRTNIPPELTVDGDLHRTVRVGEALHLVVHTKDPDNIPKRRQRGVPKTLDELYRPPSSVVAMSAPGLRFSWTVYRGDADDAVFDPVQMKTYTDTRMYANSPWSPPWVIPEPPADGRYETDVTFDEPGEYTLRGIASDGSMFTYQNVAVTVRPLAN